MDLSVQIGSVRLRNPILVASGTFGYGREMADIVQFSQLGGIIPKTITLEPRAGNALPRSVETPCGMLNAIGLDNDGLAHFLEYHLPYLRTLPTALIVNIAGKSAAEFAELAQRLSEQPGITALELNLSCPNVAGGLDFATDPRLTFQVVEQVKRVCRLPVWAKLTPNVTDIVPIARAAVDAGADALSLVNTFVGMAVDWRRRRPILANVTGGLSGPAIKPLALRFVWQVARAVPVPILGIGGITTLDDVLEFLVAGASAVQVGTANFFDPTVTMRLVAGLPEALASLGAQSVQEIVGSLQA
ncbi:MAG: dihydroorotate dehydrogenase [Gemmatales bacterium]|nr:dihydroorotate dehydrogenase [Gemmatales bacterium]MDW7994015.1 dihydroorotate dehydrogenase [Gemmatales bacterium]